MLQLLHEEQKIQQAQQQFNHHLIQSAFTEALWGKVNCMGGKFEALLHYSESFDLWYYYEFKQGKHWNAFGTGKPSDKALRIHCEINIPASGINRAVSATFAQDDEDVLHLLHRGKIRGGKALFFQHYQGPIVHIQDNKNIDDFALIARFDHNIPEQIAYFIQQVINIKSFK